MVRISGEGMAFPFNDIGARKRVWNGEHLIWHATSIKEEGGLTIDDDLLSSTKFSYLCSMRSGYLTLRQGESYIIEPYSPCRFGRQFGFHQDVPGDHVNVIHSCGVNEISQYYADFMCARTRSTTLIPSYSPDFGTLVIRRYETWWKKINEDYFSTGFQLLIDRISPLVNDPIKKINHMPPPIKEPNKKNPKLVVILSKSNKSAETTSVTSLDAPRRKQTLEIQGTHTDTSPVTSNHHRPAEESGTHEAQNQAPGEIRDSTLKTIRNRAQIIDSESSSDENWRHTRPRDSSASSDNGDSPLACPSDDLNGIELNYGQDESICIPINGTDEGNNSSLLFHYV